MKITSLTTICILNLFVAFFAPKSIQLNRDNSHLLIRGTAKPSSLWSCDLEVFYDSLLTKNLRQTSFSLQTICFHEKVIYYEMAKENTLISMQTVESIMSRLKTWKILEIFCQPMG